MFYFIYIATKQQELVKHNGESASKAGLSWLK